MKKLDPSTIKKILVISLSNIGDVILTFPVIDILLRDFSQAKMAVVVGPKAASLFARHPHLQVHIFDKKKQSLATLKWINQLRREHFDLTVDLRHTAIPVMIGAKRHTPVFFRERRQTQAEHMKVKHLNCLRSVHVFDENVPVQKILFILEDDKRYIDNLIRNEIGHGEFVLIGPGAASHLKRWPEDSYARLADEIVQRDKVRVVFIGDENDKDVAQRVCQSMAAPALNLCARTSLLQLASLMQYALLVIVNDSAPMHLASYLNVPVLAIFQTTDPHLYGPWGTKGVFIHNPQTQDVLDLFRLDQGEVKFSRHETIP